MAVRMLPPDPARTPLVGPPFYAECPRRPRPARPKTIVSLTDWLNRGTAVQATSRGIITAGRPVEASSLHILRRAIACASHSFTGLGRVVHRRTAGPAVICIGSLGLVVAGRDLLWAHRDPRQRRRRPGIDRLTQQLRHRLPRVVTQRPVQRDVRESAVARLPGTESGVSLEAGDDTRAARHESRCARSSGVVVQRVVPGLPGDEAERSPTSGDGAFAEQDAGPRDATRSGMPYIWPTVPATELPWRCGPRMRGSCDAPAPAGPAPAGPAGANGNAGSGPLKIRKSPWPQPDQAGPGRRAGRC